ncbi:Glycosyl transferase family 8 [Musa troglodytarum]|nr:Glycosyl transferase family 8 [Musa troglodytarum]
MEPARPGRRQHRRQVQEPSPRAHQPSPLEWQREALVEAGLQKALCCGLPLGTLRPLQVFVTHLRRVKAAWRGEKRQGLDSTT